MSTPAAFAEIPIAGGWDQPDTWKVEQQKALYVGGRITVDELERRLEVALLRDAPDGHPVPDGWQEPAPCEHEWLDMRTLGEADGHDLCARCGVERWSL